MRPDKFTAKMQEALNAAQDQASKFSHQELNNEHFLLALLEQTEGVTRPLLEKMGVSVSTLQERLENELARRPKVQGGQVYLGSDAFLERIQAMSAKTDIAEIPRIQRRPLAQPVAHYRDSMADRQAAMAAAYASGDYTMQQIAEGFGVHYSTVSRAVKRQEKLRGCKT